MSQSPIKLVIHTLDRGRGVGLKYTPVPIRCNICGETLRGGDKDEEAPNLASHLRGSDVCRERIDAWLKERMGWQAENSRSEQTTLATDGGWGTQ